MSVPKPEPLPHPEPVPSPGPEPDPIPIPDPPGPPQPPGPKRSSRRQCGLVAAVCLALLVSVWCHSARADEPPKPLTEKVRGFVVLVEPSSITVTVRGFQQMFSVAADARITRNGKPAALKELRPRDRVRLTVRAARDGKTAIKIKAQAPM